MMTMSGILAAFANEPLFSASERFLAHLGVKCSTQTELPIPFLELYEEAAREANAAVPKDVSAIFSRVANTYFIGSVTDDTLKGDKAAVDFKDEAKKPKYEGMFVFAVEVKPGESLSRGEAAVLVRGINRVVRQQPATVLILESPCGGTLLSIATCERTAYKQTWRPGERLGKVSILKGINCLAPHRGHIEIIESMNVKGCKTFDALYRKWREVFSTNLLTKQFYREIQNWYFWAQKKEQGVAFPNALDDDKDDKKYNAENLIRLITRLLFTWFMKEKGLVNTDLFEVSFLSKALKHFAPDGALPDTQTGNVADSCTYYRAILQNLFFATFNQEIGSRGFVNTQVLDAKRFNIKNYYRNEKLFTETDKNVIKSYFNGSPFVNGGLFECLDNVEQNGHVYSWDGFSNHVHFKDGTLKSALIPDYLFFGGETVADLSEFFEDREKEKYRKVKVRGIINILKGYVFTIEENTPFDENVALDPELLGKVFENLLGCFNPETGQKARNATGSFYTPREIVNYMVKVSLKSYLNRACPHVAAEEMDALVDGVVNPSEMPSIKANAKDILTALFKAKILDPACGSGAFPMGIMSAMVGILRMLDPDNRHWYEIVLKESLDEAASIADVGDERERAELKAQIEYDFNERVDHPDYARKLYIIEHCIFGSDIQPIAVQISRLRFFITLLCEQTPNEDPNNNYGITPLPNLESNFVAADSLLSIDLADMRGILEQNDVELLIRELRDVRHQLFLPKTSDKKKRLQNRDEELRKAIAVAAEGLYDQAIELKCSLLEKERDRLNRELANLCEADFKDVIREERETDLLGETIVTKKKIVSKGKVLLKQKKDTEAKLASVRDSSQKERLLADIRRLVAWNPFAFNKAESFLDPEWMFGVKDGFSIVIGNPPYIQLQDNHGELADLYKPCGFETFDRSGDMYCLFYESGFNRLSADGMLAFITSDKWMVAKYGQATRDWILTKTHPELLVDFSGKRIFESATVEANILFTRKAARGDGNILCCSFSNTIDSDLSMAVMQSASACLFATGEKWIIKSAIERKLFDKIKAAGKPLKEWKIKINFGVKTGLNPAFLINGKVRNQIIAHGANANSIIKPVLRGKDIQCYYSHLNDVWLIATFPALNLAIDDYPSVRDYLLSFDKRILSQTGEKDIDGIKGNDSRKKTNNKWFETQDQISFYSEFSKEKIIWKRIGSILRFSYSDEEIYGLDSTCVMTGEHIKYLLAVLNSVMGHYLLKDSPRTGTGDLLISVQALEPIHIPLPTKEQETPIIALVDAIITAKKADPTADTSALEEKIDNLVFDLYDLTPDERKIVKGSEK